MCHTAYIVYLKRELKMFSASPAESEISLGPTPAPPPAPPATANKVNTTTEAKWSRDPAQHGVLSSLAFPCLTICQVECKGFIIPPAICQSLPCEDWRPISLFVHLSLTIITKIGVLALLCYFLRMRGVVGDGCKHWFKGSQQWESRGAWNVSICPNLARTAAI